MREELLSLKEQALAELAEVSSLDALKDLRVKYLGKKGPMTEILRGMGKLPAEERPKIGQIVNEIKSTLESVINEKSIKTVYNVEGIICNVDKEEMYFVPAKVC